MNLIFNSIFFGFSIWSLAGSNLRKKLGIQFNLEDGDRMAVKAVILFGFIHVFSLAAAYIDLISESEEMKFNHLNRLFGPYWFGFWIYPFTYFGLTQLLWLEKMRTSKTFRILLAIWILIVMHIEKFIIITASMHLEFGTLSQMEIWSNLLTNWVVYFGIFGLILTVLMKVKALHTTVKPMHKSFPWRQNKN